MAVLGTVVLGFSAGVFIRHMKPILCTPLMKVFRRTIYDPTTPTQIRNVRACLKGRKGSLLDIGNGDGRIVLLAAKLGFKSSGIKLNYWMLPYSRIQAWSQRQEKNVSFYRKDILKTNLSAYDNIVVFGRQEMMSQLEKKLDKELQREGQVIACRFPLPYWLPVREHGTGSDRVWVYKHPNNYTEKRIPMPMPTLDEDICINEPPFYAIYFKTFTWGEKWNHKWSWDP